MKWIKYKILQSTIGEEVVLVNKKVGYNEENLAIAQKEAYDGYTIVDDEQPYESEPVPVPIELGGTGARDVETAKLNLGIPLAPIISQTDIVAGTTPLAAGQSYHVYE